MPKPIVVLVLAVVGVTAYVLGKKAGRSRYRDISATAKKFWDDPAVKKARVRAYKGAEKAAKRAAKKLG
jgi:uncharacterized protein (UPF0333 family)